MSSVCPKCEKQVAGDAGFCGDCGGRLQPLDVPEAVDAYTKALKRVAGHEQVEEWAEGSLKALRQELGISAETHARLSELHLPQRKAPVDSRFGSAVALEVDEASLRGFVVGRRGILLVRVRTSGTHPAYEVTVRCQVSGVEGWKQWQFSHLKPGGEESVGNEIQLTQPGDRLVVYLVRAEDMVGRVGCFKAEPLFVQVADPSAAPQAATYNIDLGGSFKPSADLGAGLPAGGGLAKGARVEARWVQLKLTAITPGQFEGAGAKALAAKAVPPGKGPEPAGPREEEKPLGLGTFVVALGGTGDFIDLEEAAARVAEGSTLKVRAGTYRVSFELKKNLNIVAEGKAVIEGAGDYCLLVHGGQSTFEGLVFTGAHGKAQCAVLVAAGAKARFIRCEFASSTAAGLVVRDEGTSVSLQECTLSGSARTGLVSMKAAKALLTGCDVHGNRAAGVVVTSQGSVVARHSRFHDNQGEGLYFREGGRGVVGDCEVFANKRAGVLVKTGGDPTIRNCIVRNGAGVGVRVEENGAGRFERCQVLENEEAGVLIETKASPTFLECVIRDGKKEGVVVRDSGAGLFKGCDVLGNTLSNFVIQTAGIPQVVESTLHHSKENGVYVSSEGGGNFERCRIDLNDGRDVRMEVGSMTVLVDCQVGDGSHSLGAPEAPLASVPAGPGGWLFRVADVAQGPYSMAELVEAIKGGRLTARSQIWRPGMSDWCAWESVGEVAGFVGLQPTPAPAPDSPVWYCEVAGRQRGPLTKLALAQAIAAGELTALSRVWRAGMEEWKPWSSVAEVLSAVRRLGA